MSYTVKKDAAGEIDILHRNGKPLFCPFKPTFLTPGRLENQMQLHREPCGSWCPHFRLNEWQLNISCGKGNSYAISQPKEIKL